MSTFLGMRGTADWVADERPKSWREMILYLYPNGKAPLTAILSQMSKESVNDPEFNWWTQTMESVSGAITSIYDDAGLGTEYTSGAAEGTTLYVKCAEALAEQIRAGHQVVIRTAADSRTDVTAKVTSVILNGASSAVGVRLLEAEQTADDLAASDRLIVIGSINPEGGEMPSAIAKNPTKFYNYTQIFRTPLEITRTARKTKLRTEDSYQRAKREALEMHSIEMEWNTLFGVMDERTGDNGKPERTTMGIVPFVRANAASNVLDYRYATTAMGVTAAAAWSANGDEWFDYVFELLARYAMLQDMVWLCGSGAISAINVLAKANGTINLTPESESFGLKVLNWITPFGTVKLMTHPLLSQESSTRNMMVGITPKDVRFRYIDDTTFYSEKEQQNTGHGRIDGTKEEYLTEGGYEFEHPEHFMILDGVGKLNLET